LLTQEFIIFDSRCQQTKYEDEEREKTAILKVVKNYLHVKPQKLIVGINLARKLVRITLLKNKA
jgi:hypothetical protein